MVTLLVDIVTEHVGGPRRGAQQPQQHADGGRLAAAVGPQVADDLPGQYFKGHIVDGRKIAKPLGQMFGLHSHLSHDASPGQPFAALRVPAAQ